MPAPYDIPPVLAEAFVCLRASRPCHVLVDLIQVVVTSRSHSVAAAAAAGTAVGWHLVATMTRPPRLTTAVPRVAQVR